MCYIINTYTSITSEIMVSIISSPIWHTAYTHTHNAHAPTYTIICALHCIAFANKSTTKLSAFCARGTHIHTSTASQTPFKPTPLHTQINSHIHRHTINLSSSPSCERVLSVCQHNTTQQNTTHTHHHLNVHTKYIII